LDGYRKQRQPYQVGECLTRLAAPQTPPRFRLDRLLNRPLYASKVTLIVGVVAILAVALTAVTDGEQFTFADIWQRLAIDRTFDLASLPPSPVPEALATRDEPSIAASRSDSAWARGRARATRVDSTGTGQRRRRPHQGPDARDGIVNGERCRLGRLANFRNRSGRRLDRSSRGICRFG
jgi:hypothetical protein